MRSKHKKRIEKNADYNMTVQNRCNFWGYAPLFKATKWQTKICLVYFFKMTVKLQFGVSVVRRKHQICLCTLLLWLRTESKCTFQTRLNIALAGTEQPQKLTATFWSNLSWPVTLRERERGERWDCGGLWREGGGHEGEREKIGALILYWILGLLISVHGLNDEHDYGNRIENWMEQSFHY